MRAHLLWLALALLGAAPAKAPSADAPKKRVLVPHGQRLETAETQCELCHVTASWDDVRFDHDKTGFPLKGKHARVDCRGCHAQSFTTPVPRQCVACHRDAHAGDLGARCEGCHDELSWKSAFDADAHRRTNFPLVGGHAVIPCQECHFESRDRRFARSTVDCAACHQRELMRTFGTAVDHTRLGFAGGCQSCHRASGFRPAVFPGHDGCFNLSQGSHANIACATCHAVGLPAMVMTGTCNTRTAACTTGCHSHDCAAVSARQHQGVMGFQCQDRRCWECHLEQRR